jgi:hypothetical protein
MSDASFTHTPLQPAMTRTCAETMKAEQKVCMILERLHDRLHDATIDYQRHRGKHEFVIRYAGFRFVVRFPEQALLRKGVQELEQAASQIVERIRLSATYSSPQQVPLFGQMTSRFASRVSSGQPSKVSDPSILGIISPRGGRLRV